MNTRSPHQFALLFAIVGINTVSAVAQEAEIVRQIEEKLAAVNEYSCSTTWSVIMRDTTVAEIGEHTFRRPNLAVGRSERTAHPAEQLIGSAIRICLDGDWYWLYDEVPAKNRSGVRSAPKVYKTNLAALREAGFNELVVFDTGLLIDPFRHCALDTIHLISESDDAWVLSAEPTDDYRDNHNIPATSISLTIGKQDGLLRKFVATGEEFEASRTITDVILNPGFDDSVFTFTPPPGVPIEDRTEEYVESLKKQAQ